MKNLKYIYQYILDQRDRKSVKLSILLMFVVSALEVLNIVLVGPFVGVLISGESGSIERALFLINERSKFLNYDLRFVDVAFFVTSFILVTSIFSYYTMRKLSLVGFALGASINRVLYHRYVKLGWQNSLTINSDFLLNLIGFDMPRLTNQVLLPLMMIVSKVTLVLLIIIILMYFNPLLTLCGIGVFAFLYGGIIFYLRPLLVANSERITTENQSRISNLNQTLNSLKSLIVSRKETLFENDFNNSGENHARALGENAALSVAPRYFVEGFLIASVVVALSLSMLIEKSSAVDFVTLSVFSISMFKMLPVSQQIYASLVSIKANFSTVHDLVYFSEEILNQKRPLIGACTEKPLVDFENLNMLNCKVISEDHTILHETSFQLNSGEKIGIVGRSGSGKSTFMDLCLGLRKPDKGCITVNGFVRNASLYKLFDVHYTNSMPFILNANLVFNVALKRNLNADESNRFDEIVELLKLDQINENFRNSNTLRADTISTGQRQRIGIARAIFANPDIYFLDEVTSSLDGELEKCVFDYFYKQVDENNKTMVVIAHNVETLENCDRIVVVDAGKIVEIDSFRNLANYSSIFKAISNKL